MAENPALSEKIRLLKKERESHLASLAMKMREQTRIQKSILDSIETVGKTVPDIAKETGLGSDVVFWHINALRRYGRIKDGAKSGAYFTYLKSQGEK